MMGRGIQSNTECIDQWIRIWTETNMESFIEESWNTVGRNVNDEIGEWNQSLLNHWIIVLSFHDINRICLNELVINRMMVVTHNCLCFWYMIRESLHRMIMKWENDYSRIGLNRCIGSCHHSRSRVHWLSVELCLHQSITQSILSRVTVPIFW